MSHILETTAIMATASPLVNRIALTTGLPTSQAARIVADVIAYYHETTEEFVRRRHAELRKRQHTNPQIWPLITNELMQRPVTAPSLSERQLRRIVYG